MIPSAFIQDYSIPVGAIIAFAGPIDQSLERFHWMPCDGRELSIYKYPQLFSALGTLYCRDKAPEPNSHGNYSPDAKFCIPDYRGYFLRGVSGDSGIDPDVKERLSVDKKESSCVGSVQKDALQSHVHTYTRGTLTSGAQSGGMPTVPAEQVDSTSVPKDDPVINRKVQVSSETRPVNIYVYYLIKYA